jgi:hypothetical protein
MPFPAMSLATWRAPCSNTATPAPMLPPGHTPDPPHRPAQGRWWVGRRQAGGGGQDGWVTY